MALHSRKEFSELCGMETKTLSVYIGRGKVIVGENEMVDDQNQVNRAFLDKHKAKKTVEKKPKASKPNGEEPSTYTRVLQDKAQAELETKRTINQLKMIEIKKKLGQVVPTESVRNLLRMHSESIKVAYMDASENLMVIFSQKAGLNAVDLADIRKKFVDVVNSAVDNAILSSRGMLKGIVEDFSEKRGVGQHD